MVTLMKLVPFMIHELQLELNLQGTDSHKLYRDINCKT